MHLLVKENKNKKQKTILNFPNAKFAKFGKLYKIDVLVGITGHKYISAKYYIDETNVSCMVKIATHIDNKIQYSSFGYHEIKIEKYGDTSRLIELLCKAITSSGIAELTQYENEMGIYYILKRVGELMTPKRLIYVTESE